MGRYPGGLATGKIPGLAANKVREILPFYCSGHAMKRRSSAKVP